MPMVKTSNQLKASSGRRRNVLEHALEIANRSDRLFVSVAEGLAGSAIAALSAARLPAHRRAEAGATSASRIDLVSAAPADAWNPLASGARVRREPEAESESELPAHRSSEPGDAAGHSAGVVPILRALGRIVAEHRNASYATLDRDDRFWTLLHLLQTLERSGGELPAQEDQLRT
jgi:hypothetical protein